MSETKESKSMGGGKGTAAAEKGPAASEQLKSPKTVEKLTFALLDKIFEGCPSLLADLKCRVEKEVND